MVKPSGQTTTRILNAADEIFIRRGIDGARVQEIADRAGVNKALLHFITLVVDIFCLFPFAARPMISEVLGLSPTDLRELMKRRRRELPAFLKGALQT